jgi:1,4-alpha-glucan branching enzyme
VQDHPPETVLNLPEGSWGAGGTHFVWDNTDTHWMWPVIHEAEARMAHVVAGHLAAAGGEREVLNQAARELLLMQSSDWPFLVSTGQAREYAVQRFQSHVERFRRLVGSVENGQPDVETSRELWEKDKVFPNIDFTWFQP